MSVLGVRLTPIGLGIRESARSLRRSPGFFLATTLTLALGIGAFTALYSVVRSVLIRPLQYHEPNRLAYIEHPVPGIGEGRRWRLSEAGYFFLLEHNKSFDGIAVYETEEVGLAGAGDAYVVSAARVSWNTFAVLGARTVQGRPFREEDNRYRTTGPPVALLSHSLWLRVFGGNPDVVGQAVRIEGDPVQVVGVLEPGFDLPDADAEVWLPAAIDPMHAPMNWHRFHAIGRLKEGVSFAQAQQDLSRLTARFSDAMPTAYYPGFTKSSQFSTLVEPLHLHVTGAVGRTLWVLLGAVSIVLLIALSNFANLCLVRIEARENEIRLRTALGATRQALGARYVGEGVILSLIAGAVGLSFALAGVPLLVAKAPPDVPRLEEISVGWEGAVVSIGLSLMTAFLVGVPALLRASRHTAGFQHGSVRSTPSRHQHRVRLALVCAEVALALVLIATAGLLIKTSSNLWRVEPGFESKGVLVLDVLLPSAEFEDERAVAHFHRTVSERIRSIPGVRSVGSTTSLPLLGSAHCALVFSDDPDVEQRNRGCFANPVRFSPGYFEAMGIPVRGRSPNWADMEGRGEVVISSAVARHLWLERDPIGRGIKGNNPGSPYYTVVGVAGDVRAEGLDKSPTLRVYFPMIPVAGAPLWGPARRMTIVVKTELRRPTDLTPTIRRTVHEAHPLAAIGKVGLLDDVVARSMARTSFAMILVGVAASIGLLLATVGLYGVVAYIATRRHQEIGIRIALGASSSDVTRMVLKQSLLAVLAGVALGLVGAVGAGRILGTLLFGVPPSDPVILAVGAVGLASVALLASWLPARRATRVDPVSALRAE